MRSTHRPRPIAVAALAAVVVLGLATAACSDDKNGASASGAKKVVVADQGFGESKIAAQIYGQLFAANGYDVSYRSLKDRAATYAAFGSGDIDSVSSSTWCTFAREIHDRRPSPWCSE